MFFFNSIQDFLKSVRIIFRSYLHSKCLIIFQKFSIIFDQQRTIRIIFILLYTLWGDNFVKLAIFRIQPIELHSTFYAIERIMESPYSFLTNFIDLNVFQNVFNIVLSFLAILLGLNLFIFILEQ